MIKGSASMVIKQEYRKVAVATSVSRKRERCIMPNDVAPHLPITLPVRRFSRAAIEHRWHQVSMNDEDRRTVLDEQTLDQLEQYQGHVERFIGTVKVPVGLAGPLRMKGQFAQGEYLLPLATTEAALVASYHRGMQVISESGGCAALLLDEGVS